MNIYCPKCGKQINADDMNLDTMVAKCRSCYAVFTFTPAHEGEHGSARPQMAPDRLKVPLPKQIQVQQEGADLVIRWSWYSAVFIFLIFFCIIWNGIVAVVCLVAFAGGGALTGGASGALAGGACIFLPFGGVGIGLVYYTLAGLVNTTVIRVCPGRLMIQHGPLPWPGKQDISSAAIQQLYCKEKTLYGSEGARRVTYELHAFLKDGRALKLLSGLPEVEHGLYIEQILEQHLGIQDQRVPGELVHY